MQREKLVLETRWNSAKHSLDRIQAKVLKQQNQISTFLLLCEKIGCQPSAISREVHEQYLKKFVEIKLQPLMHKQATLQMDIQNLQLEESEIELQCQNEKQLLAVQYRKAAYLLTGLATAGMSGACILAALISTGALYILIFSAAAAGMAAWRGQYFFQEGKKYNEPPAILDSSAACSK